VAWLVMPGGEGASGVWIQRWVSVGLALAFAGWLFYALNFEDKLPDYLAAVAGPVYYEADGLCFLPVVRMNENGQAELSLYYQNRYENYCYAVVHMRPPADGFVIRPGARDVHFTFKADGGDFGVIHQPIAVPRHLQGEIVEVQLAAVSRYPRSHGARLRSKEGMPCGTLLVDWGQAFKVGVHEVSGEIDLKNPCTLHFTMPPMAQETLAGSIEWKQEQLEPGPSAAAVLG
jgi:hypothetical protein